MVYTAVPAPSQRIEMWFSGPEQQRRWTVLIRLILAIPQAIVLFLLEIALIVVTIIGWFAALVVGRLPLWVFQFNSGYVRWYTRFIAYLYLLTDEYPPFEFDDLPYPARPIMASRGSLNRLAVLFRIILAVPAAFFQSIVSNGLVLPMLLVAWLIMVFTGRMPRALYWAYSSWVRYSTRFMAYLLLITAEYPWGMLGDREPAAPIVFPPPPGPPAAARGGPVPYAPPSTAIDAGAAASADTASGAGEGAATTTDAEDTPGEAAAPGPAPTAPAWPPPPPSGPPTWSAPPPQSPPMPWDTVPPTPPPPPPPPPPPGADAARSRLLLPPGARKWLIFAIVWGSIVLVGQISVQAVVAGRNYTTSLRQYNTVVNDFNDSRSAIENAVTQSQRCQSVQCLRPSHLAAARSLEKFDSDLKTLNLSCTATAPAQVVESDLTQLSSAFTDLANSSNAQAYRSTVQSSNLNTLLRSLPNDTNNLLEAVRTSNLGAFCAG